ncbi:MAG: hypothetical protein RIS36_139 [Pseudomonadota bacterium]|jgi:hypothetical protein
MSGGDEYTTYAEYLAALERDSKVLEELKRDLEAINQGEQDLLEALDKAESHLEKGTEEGIESAVRLLRELFDDEINGNAQ